MYIDNRLLYLKAAEKWPSLVKDFECACMEDTLRIGATLQRKFRASFELLESLMITSKVVSTEGDQAALELSSGDDLYASNWMDALKCTTVDLKLLIDELYCTCWDKLHSGPWHAVSSIWRSLYSCCCFIEALLYSFFIFNGQSTHSDTTTGSFMNVPPKSLLLTADETYLKLSYYYADMGLILGGPDNVFSRLIHELLDILDSFNIKGQKYYEEATHSVAVSEFISENSDMHSISQNFKRQKVGSLAELRRGLLKNISVRKDLSLFEFKEYFYNRQLPVLIKGGMAASPAVKKWKDLTYFRSVIGRRTVPVEIGSSYTDECWTQKLMTINEFIDKYVEGNNAEIGYVAQHAIFEQIPKLCADIITPDYVYCGTDESIVRNLWFGPKGTISPLHIDQTNNIYSQIVGQKYFCLYEPKYTPHLCPYSKGPLTNTSQIKYDLHSLKPSEYEEIQQLYPDFTSTPYYETVVEEGDLLFLPVGWWHFVKSLSESISVSFWFY